MVQFFFIGKLDFFVSEKVPCDTWSSVQIWSFLTEQWHMASLLCSALLCWTQNKYIQKLKNCMKSNRNQIVFTIFWCIWNQTGVRLVPNQSENGKCYLILVCFNKICLCAASIHLCFVPIQLNAQNSLTFFGSLRFSGKKIRRGRGLRVYYWIYYFVYPHQT